MKEIRMLEDKLEDIGHKLNGDPAYGSLDLDADFSLRRRVMSAVYSVSRHTSNIQGTARTQYEIAVKEFAPVYDEIKALIPEFEAMDKKLDALDAPTTPGRLPDFR
jgi:hypothetical protein